MTSASGARYASPGGGTDTDWRSPWEWGRGRCGGTMRWRPLELVAMILGFIVFWPIGLAILGWKMCYRHWNGPSEFATYMSERWRSAAGRFEQAAARASGGFERARSERWRPFASGNAAFDDWKAAEMSRLEEERRKLDEAHREFAEYLDNLRKARDREEFDRFRAQRSGPPDPQQPAA